MAVSVRDLIRPARPAMILSGVLTAAGAVLGIVPFVALTQLAAVWLRERSDPGWSGNPWLLIGIAAGALLGAQLLYLAGIGVTHLAEARLRHRLRQQIVDAIGRLPLGEVARIPHGTIRKMVCDDTSAIHTLVAHIPGDVTNAIVGVLAGGAYLVWVDWRLALSLLGIWLLACLLVFGVMVRSFGDITQRFGEAQTRISAATVEMLEGIKEIKNFQASESARTRFTEAREGFSGLSYEWTMASGRAFAIAGAFLQPAVVRAACRAS